MERQTIGELRDWAYEEFGHAELGDPRRTTRLVRMTASLAAHPAGKVLDVFRSGAERQGAYDFLSNDQVCSSAMLTAVQTATVRRCEGQPWVYVAIDGTSVKLTDWQRKKDFGSVGSVTNGARGLKVIHAYAIGHESISLGVLNQQWWARKAYPKRSRPRNHCHTRPLEAKETIHWVRSIQQATTALDEINVRAWFQLDREGDRYWTLKALHDSGQWFTVRSAYGHRFVTQRHNHTGVRLRDVVQKSHVRCVYTFKLCDRRSRQGRIAKVRVKTSTVTLDMNEKFTDERLQMPVYVVDVHEVGTVPQNEKPIHWRLLTNPTVDTDEDLHRVITGYAQRWKVEELHRIWKSGACRIEESQLRSTRSAVKWAIMSIVTAARIERLKTQARSSPETPASLELNAYEFKRSSS